MTHGTRREQEDVPHLDTRLSSRSLDDDVDSSEAPLLETEGGDHLLGRSSREVHALLVGLGRGGLEDVGGSVGFGEREPLGVDVDGDDLEGPES
jgi:hypothetical protein